MTAVVVLINLQAQRRPRRITTKPSQRPGTVQAWWIMPIIHHGVLALSAGAVGGWRSDADGRGGGPFQLARSSSASVRD